MKQIAETGVTDVTTHCPGCFDILDMATTASRSGINCHYGLEEILWALGDEMALPFILRINVLRRLLQNRLSPPSE